MTEHTSASKGRKIAVALGAAVIVAVLAVLLSYILREIPADASPAVMEMKRKLTLPAEVDNTTRLDDIKAEGDKVIYVMTLLEPRKEALDRAAVMSGYLSDRACKSETYLKLLNARLTVVISYRDLDGAAVQTVTITPKDCVQPEPEPVQPKPE